MGIQGLLQALKPVTETCHIREYRGRVVGVDAYVWLHRGAYGCAYELCTGGAGASSAYIRYFLSMVDLLLEHGVVPYLVFDGGPLPAKAEQEVLRSNRREEATQLALQLQLQGDHAGARNQYVRAVDVNPEMAARVIHTIKQCRPSVKYVVAPYEADAQLSYLFREGIISAVITEDSDTLPYGCEDVLFKLERNGVGQRIVLERIFSTKIPGFDLRGFDQGMFITMCILSGCDYLPSLPKLGLKKARNLVAKHKIHSRLFRMLKLDGTLPALRADQYEAEFEKAWLTFAHQVVFDVVANTTRHLTPVEDEAIRAKYSNDLCFLGTLLDDDVAQAIAGGLMDPITHARFMFDGVCIDFPTTRSSSSPPAAAADPSPSLQRIDSFFKPQQPTTATSSASSSSSSTAQAEGHNKYVGGFRIHSSPDRRNSPVPFEREAGGTNSQLSDHTSVESASASTSQSSTISSQLSLPVTQTPSTAAAASTAQPRSSAFFAAASVSKSESQSEDVEGDDNDEQAESEAASQSQQEKHPFKPLLKARLFISHRHARVAGMRRRHSVTQHGAGRSASSANHDHEQRQKENANSPIASTTSTTSTHVPTSAGKKRRRHTTSGVLSAAATNQAVAAELEGDCGALAAALAAQIVPATPDKPRRVGYLDSVSPPTNLFAQYTCDLSLDPPTLPALSGSSLSQFSSDRTASVHSASKKTKKVSSATSTASRSSKPKMKTSPKRSPLKGLNGSAEWLHSTRETVADSDDNDEDDATATAVHCDYECDSDGWPNSAVSPRLKKTRSAPPSLSVRSLDEFRFVAESIDIDGVR